MGRFPAKFNFLSGLIIFALANIVFAQSPTPLTFGGLSLLNQSPGMYPQALGQYPQTMGQYPQTMGQYPQAMGMYPQTLGMYPQTLGMYPQTLGMYPQTYPRGVDANRLNSMHFRTNRIHSTTNNFQKFVLETTGEFLPMFGRNLFSLAHQGFQAADNVPVTADYVVGPGDELVIRAWGAFDLNTVAVVDRTGSITLPRVGVVQVAGMKASQIEGFIKTMVGRLFKNFELNVTFGKLRSIKVLVVGHVEMPGNYTVSSLSTALSSLFVAGGPSSVGSMRRIEVRRNNKTVSELDLYDLHLQGDNSKDIRLLHGDVIRVLPLGSLVAVKGSVQSPAVYEIKGTETVNDIIILSGGLTATAFKGRATLERIEANTRRQIKEIELDQSGLRVPVRNGDLISIEPISPQFDQVVTLRGHVDFPRRYSWKEGMRLKDLIPEVSYLVPRKYWSRVNLLAEKKNIIQSQDINATEGSPSLVQAISLPEDPTRIARGLLNQINWQYATITRLNKNSLRNELIAFNLGAAIKENDPEENHILKAGDIITIYNQEDVPVPKAQRDSLIALKGEVVNPGVYRMLPGETLSELIGRAGGLTPDAYLYASVFTRVTVQREQKIRLEAGMARVEKEIAQATAALQARTMSPDIKNIVAAQMQARAKTIGIMRATVATGRVTLQLDREADTLQSLPQIELEDGDAFVVPSKMNEVHIMGEVYNQQSTLWNENSDVVETMAAAGGPTKHADMKELFVIRADGTVVSYAQKGRGFIHLPIYAGDTLVVPERLDFANWKYELKEWVKIFSDFAIGAAAIRVLQD